MKQRKTKTFFCLWQNICLGSQAQGTQFHQMSLAKTLQLDEVLGTSWQGNVLNVIAPLNCKRKFIHSETPSIPSYVSFRFSPHLGQQNNRIVINQCKYEQLHINCIQMVCIFLGCLETNGTKQNSFHSGERVKDLLSKLA